MLAAVEKIESGEWAREREGATDAQTEDEGAEPTSPLMSAAGRRQRNRGMEREVKVSLFCWRVPVWACTMGPE